MILIKILVLIFLIGILLFLIWFEFIRKKPKNQTTQHKKDYQDDMKYKFFVMLINIAKDGGLTKEERNKIYKQLLEIVQILKGLENMEMDNITKHELEKIVNNYLTKLIKSFTNSREKDIDKLLEGINIIKTELLKIEKLYKENSGSIDKEVEFLKRKFSV